MTLQMVSVYLRNELLYVVPMAGGGGVFWGVEPVRVSDPDVAAAASALADALADSRIPAPRPNLRDHSSPILAAAGVESDEDLRRGAANVTLDYGDEGYTLSTWVPDSEGPGWDPGAEERLDRETPIDQVASRVIEVLANAPRGS